ncbi:Recombination-associated protein RdgC [compost metagenome]
MWFKNLKIFRINPSWPLRGEDLEAALAKDTYVRGNALAMESHGWVRPRDSGGLAYSVGGQLLLTLRSEKKVLPGAVVKQTVKERAADIEKQQGYKPGKKQLKEIKERVIDELLPRSHSVYRDTRVWIDPKNNWLVIDSTSRARCDEIIGMLARAVDPLPLESLRVVDAPSKAMTNWLAEDEAPANFTIDQDTELRTSDQSPATVRYVRHSIDAEDMRRHIQAGKHATRLAMTWADRISFVLTDTMDIKRIAPLDILKENPDAVATNEDERFDSDMMLMTSELAKMLAEIVDALGGEMPQEQEDPTSEGVSAEG